MIKRPKQITYYLPREYVAIFESLSVRLGSGQAVINEKLLPWLEKEIAKAASSGDEEESW